jgi:hypothetical protein
VALGVDGDADGFSEVEVGGELEKIGNGMVADCGYGGLLGKERSGQK